MNINGKLAPIMLMKSPLLQMTGCSLVRNAGRPAHARNHAAHVVSNGDESTGKLLSTLPWNTLGTKARNKPENRRICTGRINAHAHNVFMNS